MKSNYDTIMDAIFKSEGGYVDHPSDPGGATNMGITRKTLASWRKVVPWSKLPKSEVQNLSQEEAKQIYKARYWDEVEGDLLPSGLDYAVFDYGVNSGPQKAVMELQEVVGTARDGKVGNLTLAAVAEYPQGLDALVTTYMDNRLKFLQGLSTWPVFGKGWKSRIDKVTLLSKKLASQVQEQRPEDTLKDEGNKPDVKTWVGIIIAVIGGLFQLWKSLRKSS